MLRNAKQSRHVEKARKRAEKRFIKARHKSNKLVKDLKRQIDESFALLIELGRESSVPINSVKKVISRYGVCCIALGRILQRRSDFGRLQLWMKKGILSKQSLIGFLSKESGSTKKLGENVELFDLSFGTGYKAQLKWNSVLSADLKRQIRNTLWRRLGNRKKAPS